MKIAQVSPLMERVPPKYYGGTERIVSYLTEELVRQGHEVVLFASGDSITQAELVACTPQALRLNPSVRDPLAHYMLLLEKVKARADDFDILHFHLDYLHFPLMRERAGRVLTTMHGRLDDPDLLPLFAEFSDMPLASISQHQRRPLRNVKWMVTVHHGLPISLYRFTPKQKNDYLAFLGRLSPEKRVDRAIEIALRAGMTLKVAAKLDKKDEDYFEKVARPLLSAPHVEFIGEIGEGEKQAFLGNARALLFPIDWPEPFGLVMIEAMACGTPVIAWRCGSVPEVINDGVSGFIVGSMDEAVEAVNKVHSLNRAKVRQCFESRFTAERMARDYVDLYERLAAHSPLTLSAA